MKLFSLFVCKNSDVSVYVLSETERVPEFLPFVEGLRKSDKPSHSRTMSFFETFSENQGHIYNNKEKCKYLKDDVFEFKPTKQIRVFFFKDEEKVIITHCYTKKTLKNIESQSQIDRAVSLKIRYFDEK